MLVFNETSVKDQADETLKDLPLRADFKLRGFAPLRCRW